MDRERINGSWFSSFVNNAVFCNDVLRLPLWILST